MKPIFIFSLPRAGSTLLQRMLATSDQISTVSEPWILLPFVYTLKSDGIKSEYGHSLSVQAIQDFYKQFPNGRQDYLNDLREFILKLYKNNSQPNSTYFLDKTPRYHLIINEILEIFPEGKFIFLWRNPLAVVASILNSWCNGKWKIRLWELDLYDGVDNLLSAFTENSSHVHSLQYENLVQSPSTEMKKICDYLLLDYDDQMIGSFQNISFEGKWGDQYGIKKYDSLSKNSLHNWQKTFNNPMRRYWAIKYLDWLGEENLKLMGYSYRDLIALVSNGKNMNLNGMFSDLIRSVLYPPANLLSTRGGNTNKRIKHLYY
ncbi:MAG: sulfotransferase [Thermodesulfobacteriota bacterium]